MAFQKLQFNLLPKTKMLNHSKSFLTKIRSRRSVRDFSDKAVPIELITNAIMNLYVVIDLSYCKGLSLIITMRLHIILLARLVIPSFFGRGSFACFVEETSEILSCSRYLRIVFYL